MLLCNNNSFHLSYQQYLKSTLISIWLCQLKYKRIVKMKFTNYSILHNLTLKAIAVRKEVKIIDNSVVVHELELAMKRDFMDFYEA